MTTFNLKINLGNDAMQTCGDIANALINVIVVLKLGENVRFKVGSSSEIRDINGNTVGEWSIS